MRVINDYRFRRLENSDPVKSELVYRSVGTGQIIEGASLLAQFETSSGMVLLVADEDSPFEECLHFVLMQQQKIIDHVTFGAPYTPGIFNLTQVSNNGLRFTFASDDEYIIDVADTPFYFARRLTAGARRIGGWFAPKYLSLKPVSLQKGY